MLGRRAEGGYGSVLLERQEPQGSAWWMPGCLRGGGGVLARGVLGTVSGRRPSTGSPRQCEAHDRYSPMAREKERDDPRRSDRVDTGGQEGERAYLRGDSPEGRCPQGLDHRCPARP